MHIKNFCLRLICKYIYYEKSQEQFCSSKIIKAGLFHSFILRQKISILPFSCPPTCTLSPSSLSLLSSLPLSSLPPPHPHSTPVPVSALHRSSCGSDCTTVLKHNRPVSIWRSVCASAGLRTIGSLSLGHNENNLCCSVPLRPHYSESVSETDKQTDRWRGRQDRSRDNKQTLSLTERQKRQQRSKPRHPASRHFSPNNSLFSPLERENNKI